MFSKHESDKTNVSINQNRLENDEKRRKTRRTNNTVQPVMKTLRNVHSGLSTK